MFYDNMYGEGNCVDQIKECYTKRTNDICSEADNYCASNTEFILDDVANRDEYDIRELYPDPFPPEWYTGYLNTPEVQKAIGAFTNFTESSNAVYVAFNSTGDDARQARTIHDMKELIKDNLTVVMYYGDADCKYPEVHSTSEANEFRQLQWVGRRGCQQED